MFLLCTSVRASVTVLTSVRKVMCICHSVILVSKNFLYLHPFPCSNPAAIFTCVKNIFCKIPTNLCCGRPIKCVVLAFLAVVDFGAEEEGEC